MKKDIYVFPAVFDYAPDGINVSFPDLEGCFTCGHDDGEAFFMARDVLEGFLYTIEQHQEPIPEPSSLLDIETKQNERVVLVEVNMKVVRYQEDNKAVKKTLTIPRWLENLAQAAGVNYSQLLQEALKDLLNVKERRD